MTQLELHNIDPICPYCGHVGEKAEQRDYSCINCRGRIFVKSTPDDPSRRPMTDLEALNTDILSLRRQRMVREDKKYRYKQAKKESSQDGTNNDSAS